DEDVIRRVRDYLTGGVAAGVSPAGRPRTAAPTQIPVYRLARDYGALLKMHALARRFPKSDTNRMLAASQYNLDHAPSFEEFSFA
ncbi:MAG TPA: hypothetical protein VIO12_12870, partial [Thermoanaerobaculia bacterium]